MDTTLPTAARLLTAKQVSEIVGLSVSTLSKLRLRSDGIPFRKLGAACRYAESDVHDWIASRPVRRSTSDTGAAA